MKGASNLVIVAGLWMAAATAGAQGFEYAPGTARYRLSVHATAHAAQGAAGQDVSYDTQQRMTVTLARRASDTLGLSITLDSVSGKLPNGAPIDGSSMLGVKLAAAVSPLGRVYIREGVTGPGVAALGGFADELYRFLPALPAILKPGVSWADTVSTPITQMGTQLRRSIVTTYTVLGDTAIGGQPAWRIERNAISTLAGTGNAMGQSVDISSSGTGSGALYVSRAGRYLGADFKDDLVSKATLSAQGVSIVNTQTQITNIALVP